MTSKIKKLYAEYKKADEITERMIQEASEEDFDRALTAECEKFDELVEAIMELTEGKIDEFDIRYMMTSEKYADRFESLIARMVA